MADVLSQNEIDALLSALSTGEMDAEELKKEESEKRIRNYDFKRALRFSKDQIRGLTRIHENFARYLTTYFSAQLRTFVQIGVASVDQLPYEEFIRSVPTMTFLNIFEANPLEGRILMEINPNIAYAMLDRVMGGRGAGMNKIENLTEIETKIMTQLFVHTLDSFKEAWSPTIELDPFMLDIEVNPQFLQMVSANETVVVISLNITVGEVTGMINICLPHVVIEPIIPKLSLHTWMQKKQKSRPPEEILFIESNLRNAELPVRVELGFSDMTINEFLDLDIGDCIELKQKISSPMVLMVEDTPKFLVQPGKVNRKMAVQIIDSLKEENEQW
ncbi:flagellar motor switch protein FliM [Fictibacillus iocasae]|uniref:Flagellar motor switch protein FliM n=1 Tax=Fictibacillus iocasae TaxID=2715437 RepID=A0ABW2NS79_9BACL